MKRNLLLFFILLFAGFQVAWGQANVIKGKVLDEIGNGLPGAGITVKGTSTGTVTDLDGNFEVTMPEGKNTLVIQAIGYATQEMSAVNGMTIQMQPASKELTETVVTALGIKREKRALAYATQGVSGEDLNKSGTGNTLGELEGKVSGLDVIQSAGDPGAGTYIRLRGVSSLTGDNSPLIVIDGIPIDNSINNFDPTFSGFQAGGANGNLTGGTQPTNRGMDINPADIEDISVLKGPAASALYGIQGQNGALIITTKKGNEGGTGGLHVSWNSSMSLDEVNKLPDLQNKYSEGDGGQYSYPNRVSWGAAIDTLRWTGVPNTIDPHGNIVGASDPTGKTPVTPYDPYKFFQKGNTFDNNVSLSGGDDKASMRLSIGDVNQSGVIPTTNYNKTNVNLSGQAKLTDKLSVMGGINYVQSASDKAQQGSNTSGIMLGLLRTPPTFDNSYGTNGVNNPAAYVFPDGTQRDYRDGPGYDNPYWSVNRNPFHENVYRAYGFAQANYQLFDWMTITYRFGGDVYSQSDKNAYDINSNAFPEGRVYLIDYFNKQYNSDFIINMHKKLSKDFTGSLLLGQNYFTQSSNTNFAFGDGLTLPDFLDMSNAQSYQSSESEATIRRSAFYGQGELDYKTLLFLTFSDREEKSSTLPSNHADFNYPSAGISFLFSELPGLASNAFSYGKLRFSYAGVGSDAPAQSLQTYYKTAAILDGFTSGLTWPVNGQSGYQISSATSVIGNSGLMPQHTNSYELGTDLSFLRNRINLSATAYYALTTDEIFTVPISQATGFASVVFNAGEISNKGLEISLNTTPVKTKWGLRWDLDFNWNKAVNKVVSLSNGVDNLLIAGFTNGAIYDVVGQPTGLIYGTAYVRDPKTGKMLIDDNTADPGYGMPIVGQTDTVLGNTNPKWFGSVVSNLSYKGFTLGVQIDVRHGGQIWDGTRGAIDYFGTGAATLNRGQAVTFNGIAGHVDANGNIVSTGQQNTVATTYNEYYWQNIGSSFVGPTESDVEDGSFVKLRQLSLTYAFPRSWIKSAYFKNLSLTLFMNNIILWTKYKGVDPETSLGGPANGQGLDYFNNPGIKSYGIRLNVGL